MVAATKGLRRGGFLLDTTSVQQCTVRFSRILRLLDLTLSEEQSLALLQLTVLTFGTE